MSLTGGCYCGEVRFEIDGDPIMKAMCGCEECQTIAGGSPNAFMAVPEAAYKAVKGEPKGFTRTDIEGAVTRKFCGTCGTQIMTVAPALPGAYIIKVGALDDKSAYGGPDMVMFTSEMQDWQSVPSCAAQQFERFPGG